MGLSGRAANSEPQNFFQLSLWSANIPPKPFSKTRFLSSAEAFFAFGAAEVVGVGYEIGGFRRAFREVENRVELH